MTNDSPTTQPERDAFAAVLRHKAKVDFNGIAKDAYVAAGVNSGTWTRLVEGLSTKPYIVVTVVNRFWPEADGDWRRVPGMQVAGEMSIEELQAEIERLRAELRRRKRESVKSDVEGRIVPTERPPAPHR